MDSRSQAYDVTIVGGGHNGLTAAGFIARAGLSVLVLERLDQVGGATVSVQPFAGHAASFSRYTDLVQGMPRQLLADLDLDLTLAARSTASYSPTDRNGQHVGLLVEHPAARSTAASFRALTGGDEEYDAWCAFHAEVAALTSVVTPTLLGPLPTEREIRDQVAAETWQDLVTRPVGETLERRFGDDTVRGLVAADALLGTSMSLHDPSLSQNRGLLYQLLGAGPDAARVPVGGMGALSAALAKAAGAAGAELLTGAGVSAIRADADGAEVTWHDGDRQHSVTSRHVLADVAPWVLRILMGEPDDPESKPEGSQLRIALLLDRLPALRSGIDSEVAFAGTLHVAEDYSRLEAAYADAADGRIPATLPGRVHCHSLTDPTVLGEAADGRHTLTYLGLHTPASLFEGDREATKELAVARALAAIDEQLDEPIESCLARDADGNPCLEARVPQDLEAELAMPDGHLHHGELEWPWAPNRARLDTPAQQWGVQTDVDSVLVCGSGSRRGGGVTGLGGHNAAQAVLASR